MKIFIGIILIMGQLISSVFSAPSKFVRKHIFPDTRKRIKREHKPLTPKEEEMARTIFLSYKLRQAEKEYGLTKDKTILTGLTKEDIKRIRDIEYMKDKP